MVKSNAFPPAYVDAGLLQSFATDIIPLHQEDILNSILLAQLAANKKNSKFSETRKWYSFYGDTLGNLAWQASGFTFDVYKPTGDFYLKDVIEKQFSTRVGGRELKAVKATIEQYNLLPPDSKPSQVFYQSTQCSELASEFINVQVGVAWGNSDLSVIGVVFETSQSITELFKGKIDRELILSDVQIVAFSGTLNEAVYQSLRKSVVDKLGPKREEFILSIDLEGAPALH